MNNAPTGSMSYKDAVAYIYRTHIKLVRMIVQRVTRIPYGEDNLEDLVSEVFTRILEAKPRYRGECNMLTWSMSIARFTAIEHIQRRKSSEHLVYMDTVPEQASHQSLDTETDNRIRAVRACVVLDALSRINPENYETFVMRAIDGATEAEVAERLGIGKSTVGWRMREAREYLRKAMK